MGVVEWGPLWSWAASGVLRGSGVLAAKKDIWFLLRVKVCKWGNRGNTRSSPSRLLSTMSSSRLLNALSPSSDLR